MFHYQVCRGGQVLLQATDESCRHPAHIEADLLSSGYEIYIDGKKPKASRKTTRMSKEDTHVRTA